MAWKQIKCAYKDPQIVDHNGDGSWWMVNMENDVGGLTGWGFKTKEDAQNAVAMARGFVRIGYTGMIDYKVMQKVNGH